MDTTGTLVMIVQKLSFCKTQSGSFSVVCIECRGDSSMKQRLERLLCVKSIVTILLAVVFCALALRGELSADQFLTVFTVVISFYFGTQHERRDPDK